MYLVVSIFIGLFIVLSVYTALRVIRNDGGNPIYQLAFAAALSNAVLGFLEFQILQIQELVVMQTICQAYAINALIVLYCGFISALVFVQPFKQLSWKWLIKYQYAISAIPLIYLAMSIGFNQFIVAKDLARYDNIWYYTFNLGSITSLIYIGYCTFGVGMMIFCFWKKLKDIILKSGQTDKKIILAIMTLLPIVTLFFFLVYAQSEQVPFMISIPIGCIVFTLCWAYADFNIFRIDSKVALDEILQSMSNAMIITNLQFVIVEINQEAKKILNRENADQIGENLLRLIRANEVIGWKPFARKIAQNKSKKHTAELAVKVSGKLKHYKISFSPVINKSDRQTGYLLMALNITKEKQKEKELEARSNALKKIQL